MISGRICPKKSTSLFRTLQLYRTWVSDLITHLHHLLNPHGEEKGKEKKHKKMVTRVVTLALLQKTKRRTKSS